MNVELNEGFDGKVPTVQASEKLTRVDYHHFAPEIERLIRQHGKIRVLFDMHDLHGWKAATLAEDVKFDVKQFRDIERLAIVRDKTWEKWMATFCRPFTTVTAHYFDREEVEEAHRWIEQYLPAQTSVASVESCGCTTEDTIK